MIYNLLKIPARLAFLIYCRYVKINGKKSLHLEGPLLICANHPDSLLDAVILSTLFKRPVHSLARGDAFKNKFYASLLRSIHMLPVYRVSEGVENLEQNYETFDACKKIFKKGGIVLIFSEGRCINEWKLRPLMKGTARLATSSWQEGIDLRILPVGINYHSFHSFGKNIQLNFGEIFNKDSITREEGFGKAIISFNDKLRQELSKLVTEIKSDDKVTIRKKFYVQQP
ncbi:MAG TPA: 1-acyl-sn-glycerol-3-phosphate acyltransferase, partial [Ferruginibacter sp.]|nr:1-acyl-sn-glycerol-3-phosphate acyltransferase [Ferruginibacter sp.]